MDKIEQICSKFGGKEAVAALLGLTKAAPYHWREYIPAKHHKSLVDAARERGIDLDYPDFHGEQ